MRLCPRRAGSLCAPWHPCYQCRSLPREPTQAADVGARHDIIDAIREAAKDGCGVLIASIDAADLAVLCDRVLVFRNGAVTGELNQDDIIHATFGSSREEERWAG